MGADFPSETASKTRKYSFYKENRVRGAPDMHSSRKIRLGPGQVGWQVGWQVVGKLVGKWLASGWQVGWQVAFVPTYEISRAKRLPTLESTHFYEENRIRGADFPSETASQTRKYSFLQRKSSPGCLRHAFLAESTAWTGAGWLASWLASGWQVGW